MTTWVQVTEVDDPLVTFTTTFVFGADDVDADVLTSTSTLRLRHRAEVESDPERCGLEVRDVRDVRDAPDRPGLELVVLAQASPWELPHP